jgi:hypothetical protein
MDDARRTLGRLGTRAVALGLIGWASLSQAASATTAPSTAPAATTPAAPPVTVVSTLAKSMQWVGPAVSEPDYYVWCTSPVDDDAGKTHLFVSRWPKKYRMNGWRTHCEVAHYVGDSPEGPFVFKGIALPSNPDALWNNSIHNPSIRRVGSRYVLYYMSFDRRPSPELDAGRGPNYLGMAIADSPDGPWKVISDKEPLFKPSTDPKHWSYGDWQCNNPTMVEHGGKFYLYFRGGKKYRNLPSYAYAYATADKVEGPYTIADDVCTENIAKIEDATAFEWNGKFCLLTTDNYGAHTGIPGAGILWMSDTPEHFKLADAQVGYLLSSDYNKNFDPAKVKRHYGRDYKFERPGILMRNGKPAYFYGSSGFNFSGGDAPESYVLKINLP